MTAIAPETGISTITRLETTKQRFDITSRQSQHERMRVRAERSWHSVCWDISTHVPEQWVQSSRKSVDTLAMRDGWIWLRWANLMTMYRVNKAVTKYQPILSVVFELQVAPPSGFGFGSLIAGFCSVDRRLRHRLSVISGLSRLPVSLPIGAP